MRGFTQEDVVIAAVPTGGQQDQSGPILTHAQILELLRFLNLNRTQPPIPLFTFCLSLFGSPPHTQLLKPCYHFGTGDIPAVFPWLSGAFAAGSQPASGNVTSVFQADVTPTVEWGEGGTQ